MTCLCGRALSAGFYTKVGQQIGAQPECCHVLQVYMLNIFKAILLDNDS
jgi:hypothetical protein